LIIAVIRICYRLWAVLEALRFFLVILGEGSLRRAAKRLHISQPALTRHMQLLEHDLGGRLLERTSAGVRPTGEGHALAEKARALLGYYDSTMAEARRMVRGESDQLRVGYLHAVRCAPVGIRPGLFARNQGRGIGQALRHDQVLESRKPMIIVMRTVVRFHAAPGGIELVPKRDCPFLPCEISLLRELHRECECLSLPRLGKHRLALILR